MMSKKKWFVLLCLFIIYLLLGAGIFFNVESEEETKRLEDERMDKIEISDLIQKLFKSAPIREEQIFFKKMSDYCGKPISRRMHTIPCSRKWDFYHSLFFVITVVSTIGYGNLAPTTMFSRIFMIFYGLIGIPMNGLLMVNLGNLFGRSFTKLYNRWKTSNMKDSTARLGLITQIVLYLVPGFTFFIFLPSAIMVVFEGWAFDVAVYFCFVTLTTIGFGDYVAGIDNVNNFTSFSHWAYKIFLLFWVIGGLGYVVMILGFITQAMSSKRIQAFEQIITQNIKKTPVKIRQELRTLLQEFLFLKVKRVYKNPFDYTPQVLERSQSCPELNLYRNPDSPTMARKRALSECPQNFTYQRIQSDTDLANIDKDLTFQTSEDFIQNKHLILKLVNALGEEIEEGAYNNLPDEEILASERYGSHWSLKSTTFQPQRRRAVSDIRVPSMHRVEARNYQHQDFQAFSRERTASEPSETEQSFLTRLKNKFIPKDEKSNFIDVEKSQVRRASMFTTSPEDRYLRQTNRGRHSVLSMEHEAVLEQTSIADFIRALTAITVPELPVASPAPKRKLGTAGLSVSPPRARRLAIRPHQHVRRTSLMPETSAVQPERRRLSLRPVEENLMAPPPYSLQPLERPLINRRYSRVTAVPTITISPVQRQVNKREKEDGA